MSQSYLLYVSTNWAGIQTNVYSKSRLKNTVCSTTATANPISLAIPIWKFDIAVPTRRSQSFSTFWLEEPVNQMYLSFLWPYLAQGHATLTQYLWFCNARHRYLLIPCRFWLESFEMANVILYLYNTDAKFYREI